MDLQHFLKHYPEQVIQLKSKKSIALPDTEFQELIHEQGGRCVQKGLFRIFTSEQSEQWTALVCDTFDALEGEVVAFGMDWMGRLFAKQIHQPVIVMADSEKGEFYTMENSLEGFFNEDLVEYAEDTLQIARFEAWNTKGITLNSDEAVGYVKPLKNGGEERVENMQVMDAVLHWERNKSLHESTQ